METCFLWGLSGRVVLPWDPSYNKDRQGFNRAAQSYPFIINYCQTPRDVSNAILWARRNGVEIRIRNGGHNYEGYSSGNGVLVIDVSDMTGIEMDEQAHTVRVQGGVTNKQLYEFVAAQGYPFPGGTCPTVGVCGYALGGGWGLSCRAFGLGCDSIEEIELVNYEGRVIRASSRINCDLFWALRGAGGGNFGVVTSVTFRLPPPVQRVTLIEIDYRHVDAKTQELFLWMWQQWLRQADNRMTLLARIYNSDADGLAALVRGIFYGEPEEAHAMLYGFLSIPGAVPSIESMSFLQAVTRLGSAYPAYERFRAASRFVFRDFCPCEIREIVSLIQERPAGSVFAGISLYALGGQVAETGRDETAFFYRNAHYILWLESVFEENRFAAASSLWVSKRLGLLKSLTRGSYVNFPYAGLGDFKWEYFGAHEKRLELIKCKYDPRDVFTFPQGLARREKKAPFRLTQVPTVFGGTEFTVQAAKEKKNHRGFRYVSPQA
jgi:hypothetical protein